MDTAPAICLGSLYFAVAEALRGRRSSMRVRSLLRAAGLAFTATLVAAGSAVAGPPPTLQAQHLRGATLRIGTASATASANRQRTYGGTVAGADPISLRGDATGKRLAAAAFTATVRCADGTAFPVQVAAPVKPAPARGPGRSGVLLAKRNAGGRFATSLHAGTDLGNGVTALLSIDYAGKLAATSAAGTLRVSILLMTLTADGARSQVCGGSSRTWKAARAPGRIYAGTTTQAGPVVLTLNRARTSVQDFRIGWFTDDCTPQGTFMRISDEATKFPVKGGAFGDSWTETIDGSGGPVKVDRVLDGKLTRTAASGHFAVQVSGTQADGSPATCTLPSTRWTAASG